MKFLSLEVDLEVDLCWNFQFDRPMTSRVVIFLKFIFGNYSTRIFNEKFPDSQLLVASKWNEEQRWTRSKVTRCKLNDVSKWIGWNAVNFLNEKPFLLCGSRHWWLWPMKRLNISEIFIIFFFFVRWKKKKAGENDEIGKWLRAFSRSETSGHRNNGDCFVCWFSLSACTCRGKGLKFVIVLRRFSHGPFFSELETQKIDWKLFFFKEN